MLAAPIILSPSGPKHRASHGIVIRDCAWPAVGIRLMAIRRTENLIGPGSESAALASPLRAPGIVCGSTTDDERREFDRGDRTDLDLPHC